MQNGIIRNGYDIHGMRRVAGVLLRHIRPQNRTEAQQLLNGKLGVFLHDHMALAAEVELYFAERPELSP